MKKLILLPILFLASIYSFAQPRESMSDKIKKAFSLVGRWEIVRMEVDRSGSLSNPSNVPETAMGAVTVLLRSDLGESGYFDVAPGGAISGYGKVVYQFNVSAGTSAFSWGPVNLPIGASASMSNDNGVRDFSFTGSADLSARTIFLNVFAPTGRDLQMIIRPGGKTFTSVLWPPMTKVGPTKVVVNGSSMLLRASAVLSGIKVEFEAVKYVNLSGLFTDIEQYIDERITTIINNGGTVPGNNTNTGGNNSTGPTTTTTNNNETGSGGGMGLLAGNITIPIGQSANVVFRSPRANANYAVSLTTMNTSGNIPEVSYSDKTATGFKVHVRGTGLISVKIDWMVTPYNSE